MTVPVKDSIKVNFGGGLNLKSDPKQVDASQFLAINNVVYTVEGQLTKRNGFAGGYTTTINTPSPALTYSNVGNSLTSAVKLFAFNDELLLNDRFNLYSWDQSNLGWNYKGRSTVVGLTTAPIMANKTIFSSVDFSVDTTTGVKIFVGSANDGANNAVYSIQDTTTGQFIVNQAVFGVYNYVRCISIAGKSWIFGVNGTGKIDYLAIVGQTPAGSVTTNWITNLNAKYTFTVSAANATVGATYTNNGVTFTVAATIAGTTTLIAYGAGPPAASGTLTKASGTGDATITFSVGLLTGGQFYDVDVDANTGNIYVAWASTVASISVAAVSTSLVIGNTITKVESATNGLSWFGDGTNIWVVYNNAAATKAFIVNNAVSATTLAPTIVDNVTATNVNNVTGCWSSTQSLGFIFYDLVTLVGANTTTSTLIYNTMTVGGSAGTGTAFIGNLTVQSKAFPVSGIPHITALYSIDKTQATNFLLNIYNVTSSMGSASFNSAVANIAAKISPDEAAQTSQPGGINGGSGSLPSFKQSSSGVWEGAGLQNNNYGEQGLFFPAPTALMDVQFNFNLANPDEQTLGNNANIAGGQVSMYDGARLVEQNFHIYPPSVNQSSGIATGGGGTHLGLASSDSLYSYIFVYEWIDNQGQLHRSFPSAVMTPLASGHSYTFASGTTDGVITLTVPFLRVTNKPGTQVVVNIYRTVANGSVYFLITPTFGTLVNNPQANSTSYIDNTPDSLIIGNIQIYTTGALGYYAPPASSALTNFKNRAIQIPSENPFQIGYSNAVLQNFPVQFVPEFLQNIGTVGGALITVAQMDDKMILFKNGKTSGPSIYYMQGIGPAASGANNDFQDPLPVTVDAGCVDRPSVVLTPVGLMFKSNKGVYLLDRALQAEYIGAPVESYNQYSVLSAQLIPNATQVRFWLSNGTLLMYDYFFKKWSTWTPPAGISDCIYQGLHTYVSSTGQVYQETPGIYIDGTATAVLMSFTTAWIKLAGLVGYQRAYFFYLLAGYISAHKLSLSLFTDFSTTPDSTVTITPDSTKALENWRIFFAKQRCQSFQIQLTEVSTGVLGQGFNMSGLNLIVGAKNKFRTISAAQSVG